MAYLADDIPGKASWFYYIQIALNRAGITGEAQGKTLDILKGLTRQYKWKWEHHIMTEETEKWQVKWHPNHKETAEGIEIVGLRNAPNPPQSITLPIMAATPRTKPSKSSKRGG